MVSKEFLAKGVRTVSRLIPGFASYQEKEKLRDLDKRLRDHLAAQLDQERLRIDAVKAALVKKRRLEGLDDLDALTRKFQQLADTLRFASYGYAPLFSQSAVDTHKLEELYQYDLSLESTLEEVTSAVESLASTPEAARSEDLSAVEHALDALENLLTRRQRVLAPAK